MLAGSDTIYFSAVLTPNPCLSITGRRVLLAAVTTLNLAFATMFVFQDAWPVTPFMGADILLLAWALWRSGRAAKRREEVRVTCSELRVDYYPPNGNPTSAGLNPYWVRVHLDEKSGGAGSILLASHGRRLRIGAFLPPRDRLVLAQALTSALATARQAH